MSGARGRLQARHGRGPDLPSSEVVGTFVPHFLHMEEEDEGEIARADARKMKYEFETVHQFVNETDLDYGAFTLYYVNKTGCKKDSSSRATRYETAYIKTK